MVPGSGLAFWLLSDGMPAASGMVGAVAPVLRRKVAIRAAVIVFPCCSRSCTRPVAVQSLSSSAAEYHDLRGAQASVRRGVHGAVVTISNGESMLSMAGPSTSDT